MTTLITIYRKFAIYYI